MSDITFVFFHVGFYWLYFFIFHRPVWINNRIKDIETTLIVYLVDFISIFTIVFLVQILELTNLLLRPIFMNLIYPFRKVVSFFLKRVKKSAFCFFIIVAENVIDFLIIGLDFILFDLSKRVYLELVEPELFAPVLDWIKPKKLWVQNKILFAKQLYRFYIKFF